MRFMMRLATMLMSSVLPAPCRIITNSSPPSLTQMSEARQVSRMRWAVTTST